MPQFISRGINDELPGHQILVRMDRNAYHHRQRNTYSPQRQYTGTARVRQHCFLKWLRCSLSLDLRHKSGLSSMKTEIPCGLKIVQERKHTLSFENMRTPFTTSIDASF